MALNYLPVTEEITPPITPPRAQAMEIDTATETVPETPSPAPKPGGVGAVAHGAHPRKLPQEWVRAAKRELLNSRDATPHRHRLPTLVGRHLTMLRKRFRSSPESSSCVTSRETYTRNCNACFLQLRKRKLFGHRGQSPAAGLMTRHQDTYYIPPPRAIGGARGNSAPVSTATLGLIQRQDPSLAAQLREDPASMMTQATRHKVYSTMCLIRAGMLGQLTSLQQWEEAIRRSIENFIFMHFVILHISVLVSLHYYVISLHSCSHTVYLCEICITLDGSK